MNWISLSILGECKILDRGIPGGSGVKNLPAIQEIQETRVQSLGWEDTLEKEMAIHSSILAWRIPRTASLAGYSPWDCKESDTIEATEHAHTQELGNLECPEALSHLLTQNKLWCHQE